MKPYVPFFSKKCVLLLIILPRGCGTLYVKVPNEYKFLLKLFPYLYSEPQNFASWDNMTVIFMNMLSILLTFMANPLCWK